MLQLSYTCLYIILQKNIGAQCILLFISSLIVISFEAGKIVYIGLALGEQNNAKKNRKWIFSNKIDIFINFKITGQFRVYYLLSLQQIFVIFYSITPYTIFIQLHENIYMKSYMSTLGEECQSYLVYKIIISL